MEDRLRRYVDDLFAEAAPTKKAVELKEEMIQNLQDKYNDLLSEGKTQEAAYNIVVAGIGDIGSLLDELAADTAGAEDGSHYALGAEALRLRSAMFTSIAVMGYILSPLPLIILALLGFGSSARIGVPILFVMVAASTGLLVFNSMSKPRRYGGSDTIVEEFRAWQSDTQSRKSLRRAISFALWSIIVALYFILSFATYAWEITWVIFILGVVVEAFINIFFTIKK